MDPDTSDESKTVSPVCSQPSIDEVIALVESEDFWNPYEGPSCKQMDAVDDLVSEVRRLRRVEETIEHHLADQVVALETQLARVEALLDMQHDDSLIAVSDIRRALRGEP